ncbi:MAG TPA: hypothetical protein VJQ43_04270 [Thermoplasmata archaeon]|nr:hypothetical protein [Thermoplasmata archaeon]
MAGSTGIFALGIWPGRLEGAVDTVRAVEWVAGASAGCVASWEAEWDRPIADAGNPPAETDGNAITKNASQNATPRAVRLAQRGTCEKLRARGGDSLPLVVGDRSAVVVRGWLREDVIGFRSNSRELINLCYDLARLIRPAGPSAPAAGAKTLTPREV